MPGVLRLPKVTYLLNFNLLSFMWTLRSGEADDKLAKPKRYFSTKPLEEVIQEADHLFNTGKYLEVYELLNRLKFNDNADVQWRIGRALFKLSRDNEMTPDLKVEIVNEAYQVISIANVLESDNANVCKWMALIMDAKHGNEGIIQRVQGFRNVKKYLKRALELNPSDVVCAYVLGKWCFEISKLTKFQKWLAQVVYGQFPDTTYEEAYVYLLKCYENFHDLYYIPNVYMLGEVCYHMQMYYKARIYLVTAATLAPRTSYEVECSKKAKNLLKRLDLYEMNRDRYIDPF